MRRGQYEKSSLTFRLQVAGIQCTGGLDGDRMPQSASLKSVLRWRSIPEFLLAVGVWTMIQLHHFIAAYVCCLLVVLWAVAAWMVSDTLYNQFLTFDKAKHRRNPDKPRSMQRFRYERNKLWVMRIAPSLLGIIVIACGFSYVHWEQVDWQLVQLYGRLYPGSDPHYGPCIPMKGAVTVHLGDDALQVSKSNLPITLIRIHGKDAIVLDRDDDGALVLIVDVRDKNDNLIVRLDRHEFRVNPNNYFKVERPRHSRSELIVTGQDGSRVIDALYANENVFSLTGRLFVDGQLFDFSTGIDNAELKMHGVCIAAPNLRSPAVIMNF